MAEPIEYKTQLSSSGDEMTPESSPAVEKEEVSLHNMVESTFEPINTGDRQALARLASTFSNHESTTITRRATTDLERKDTLDGIDLQDDVLDPSHEQFDSYKWARMFMKLLDEEGVKLRRAGVVFQDLNVSGSGSALQLQKNVGSLLLAPFRAGEYLSFGHREPKRILKDFNGFLKSGELLVVLGRPGSGCSTLLKTICGETHGLNVEKQSKIHYRGIPSEVMHKEFSGEVVYNQEVDKHFPHLTVGQTLEFAAASRTPQNRILGASRVEMVKHVTQVVMAIFGLSHTYNTKVGNDFVRGVSGGERKRVSIAEMALAAAPIAAWDNSTRGLDAATALEFVKSLRMSANIYGSCHAVAIYQASQAIYDVFDKAVVLYEGREIYFGPSDQAEAYFLDMGWFNPPRQTTGDFLTSITNPQERQAKKGMEDKVPRTPDEFASYWKASPQYAALRREIEAENNMNANTEQEFRESKVAQQAKHVRPKSPYIISTAMQVKLCTKRAYQRLWNDKTSTLTTIIGQIAMALIIGSIYYGTPDGSAGFFSKGAVLFFAILLNALISISEINSLYDQRPIVEKQTSFAFVHPFAEAFGGIVSDIPVKFIIATVFNIILYFLAGLRQEPSQFFIYFLFSFISILTMSFIFRSLAALTKSLAQAMALAGVMVLAIVIYSGFVVPIPKMHPWFSWIRYINPVFYAFEALIANEFHGRDFACSQFVPASPDLSGNSFICSVVGAVAGQQTVSGDAFIMASYEYTYSHIWRNFGIILAFLIAFFVVYLLASELNSATSSTAEFLVFRRGHVPKSMQSEVQDSETAEMGPVSDAQIREQQDEQVNAIPAQKDIFTWRNVCYDIPVKEGERRLLDNVSGWVKPGTLTALMGVSGAGKTTLLDVLAQRVSIGVVTGDMLVNGAPLDASFQRKTGYVQQQDLHLETSTVREALRFSAILRQPKSVPKEEKYDYVEDVIKMLHMEEFANAVVGNPGEGLNVEQRKLLTIGVELAAKPALLLFLDEPTSGLDSQSSWAICAFLRKLADNGQAVLSTIHQPSAILFQEFDRLLFLAKGGKTVYFGDIGKQSRTLLDYFEANGARHCHDSENPAEYMLEIIGAGTVAKATKDWPQVWRDSQEAKDVQKELDRIHETSKEKQSSEETQQNHAEFAMPFANQLWHVTVRVFQQYWRQPSYIYSKLILGIASALFIGFSFWMPDSSQQGFQNVLFSVFMLTSIFSTLVQQIMPKFVTQRSLYEVRERPSKSYSWAAFLIANIVVEIPYQILLGVVVWASFYFPVFTAVQSAERQGLLLLFCIQFFVFASTFADLVIAALPDAETGGNIATLMFALTLTFNGVMQPPNDLPGFWIFMYRVSPLTYLVAGMTGTGLHGREIICSDTETSIFNPPADQTCGQYLSSYLQTAPGRLYNPDATSDCSYCALSNADQYLASSNIYWTERWANFGYGWIYIGFNIFGAVALYYMFRVKHYNPTSIVRRIKSGAVFIGRLFKRRSGETPKGKEAENGRIF